MGWREVPDRPWIAKWLGAEQRVGMFFVPASAVARPRRQAFRPAVAGPGRGISPRSRQAQRWVELIIFHNIYNELVSFTAKTAKL